MRRIGFPLLSLITPLLIIICQPVFGQTSPDAQVVKTRTDLVNVGILARQKKTGRIVTNLTQNDFTIFEDGVLKPEDEVAIMTFSNKVALAQPFTRDRQLIADKVMAVERQHHSEQHYFNAGIYEAANYMSKAANPTGRRAIIVLTSLEASIDFSRISEKKALEALLESGALVSGVLVKTVGGRIEQGIRGKPTSILRHIGLRSGSLKMFVEETGGELIGAEPEKMEDTFTRMVSNIAESYSLAYLPTNSARDGKRRKIQVQLSPEVEKREGQTALITRRSYIMPKDAN